MILGDLGPWENGQRDSAAQLIPLPIQYLHTVSVDVASERRPPSCQCLRIAFDLQKEDKSPRVVIKTAKGKEMRGQMS